jgi:ABC-type sugar transport system substrate-binding protein
MRKLSLLVVSLLAFFMLVGCGSGGEEPAADDAAEETFETLVVGYAQIGAESEWRTANTASIKETAEELGVELKFSDAQQKQENQIAAIRSYIAEGVDVIGFSPVVETGWETVLQEAPDRPMLARMFTLSCRRFPESPRKKRS